jgi:hypothetical protein
MSSIGKKTWVFVDGDMPPAGSTEPFGHEALMVLNSAAKDAVLSVDFFFEENAPVRNVSLDVPAEKVRCFRLDKPLGRDGYVVPRGQYAITVKSTVPVVAVFGRLDRRPDMAYYSVQGYSL